MGKKNENEEMEIDLKELFLELVSNWVKIAVSIVLLAAIMFLYSKFLVTPLYTSTSTLYVLSSSTSITSLADIQIGSSLTNDYMEVVGGRPVLDQVIENLDLDMEYGELSGKLSFENPADSRMLEITASDPDPETAKVIADEVAEVASAYIAEKMNQDPPNIIQYGYVNDSPSSPNIRKNTAMGGAVGAVLAIIIVCITYLLNDTIMTPEDMERKVGLNVLGSIPMDESEYDGDKKGRGSKKGKGKK